MNAQATWQPVDLDRYLPTAIAAAGPVHAGRLCDAVGLMLEARGCRAQVGDLMELRPSRGAAVAAEVVGLRGDRTLLMPLGSIDGLASGTPIYPIGRADKVPVGRSLLGRVVDGLGRPLDGGAPLRLRERQALSGLATNPLRRRPVEEPFAVGVRAIDALLTLGKGQRIGIFAGAGVGKSTLLGMMARNAVADVAVIALIGERGREVEEFVRRTLGKDGMAHTVVVAATVSEPPLVRIRAALYATAIAEYFRAQQKSVLLVMDSLTRYAMALREVGLASGEPATTKSYTPSVFSSLSRLLERAGTTEGDGVITGVYTVLVEGDDLNDPISDAARSILDGHIVLSRALAEKGHFPAIDIPRSLSRVMTQVVAEPQTACAYRVRELLSTYREAEDLLSIGMYKKGASPRLDQALERMPAIEAFLRQNERQQIDFNDAIRALEKIGGDRP